MVSTGTGQAISDLEFDLLAALKNKSDAVQTYNTYIQDAQATGSQPCAELFQKLQQADLEHAQEIRHHLQEVMQKGKM
uniref:Ferritin-like diiron domain-containing protein n=1 Tax=Cyanothece sp. (strain PCC 7425 / ATCC 29141) TaxID=395961 RepID=B8HPT3_CYAP4